MLPGQVALVTTVGAALGARPDRAHALAGIALGRPDTPGEALASSAELVRLAERVGDDSLMYAVSLPRGEALLVAGDLDRVDRLIEAEERAADRRGVPYPRWLSLVLRATRAIAAPLGMDLPGWGREALGPRGRPAPRAVAPS
jgi:hypothetical protein